MSDVRGGNRSIVLGGVALQVWETFAAALLEAYAVSQGSSSRMVAVVDLARIFDGERQGYVIMERPAGRFAAGVCALVAAI